MSAQRSFAVVSLLVAAALPFGRPLEAGRGPVPYVRPLISYDWSVVERVRARAAARLDDPECGKLLTDFRDYVGRPLGSNLQALAASPSQYLLHLSFLGGSSPPPFPTPPPTPSLPPHPPPPFLPPPPPDP